MERPLLILVVVFLIAKYVTGQDYTYWTRESLQQHMFAFGEEAGDEKMLVASLPQTKDLNDKIIFSRGKFDQIKIFKEGYAELHNEHVNIEFTPVLAPSYLPYSLVKSGHVWYRETSDAQTLSTIADEMQSTMNVTMEPRSVKVITWQFQEVEPRYLECSPENRASNNEFCDCLDPSISHVYVNDALDIFMHLACECFFLIEQEWTYYAACSSVGKTGDYRISDCDDYSGHIPFNTKKYCICEARGYSVSVGLCAAIRWDIFNFDFNFSPVETCDLCECDVDDRPGYCYCNYIDRHINVGKMSCFILFAAGLGECFYFPYSECGLAHTCDEAGDDRPSSCDCVLPANPTELDLHQCLLTDHKHQYIWLCDDPNPVDLRYCGCIQSRTQNNTDDEIYCKCWVVQVLSGSGIESLCDCLSDQGYSGAETPAACARRSTLVDLSVFASEGVANHITRRNEVPISNTFQAVIVHDRRETYVFFTYSRLQYHDKNTMTKIGIIDQGTSTFSGYQHPYPQHIFLRLFMLWDSNMGMKGRWVYQVNGRDIWQPDWTPEDGTIEYRYPP